MVKGLGGWVEVHVEAGAAIELQVGYEGRAEGGLRRSRQKSCTTGDMLNVGRDACREARRTLPAPAGPMTMTPNLLILVLSGRGPRERLMLCVEKKAVDVGQVACEVHAMLCIPDFLPSFRSDGDAPPHHEGQLQTGVVYLLILSLPGVGVQIFTVRFSDFAYDSASDSASPPGTSRS